MVKKHFITWQQFHRDAQALVWNLPQRSWQGIVAITRGGLVPAAVLGRTMDIKKIETLCISSYDDVTDTQTEATILKPAHESVVGQGAGWLVVDDLADTGVTFQMARAMMPQAFFVSLYAKKHGKAHVDAYVSEINAWIVFPWEEDAPDRLG